MIEGAKTVLRAVDVADGERLQRWVNESGFFTGPGGVPGAYSRKAAESWLLQAGANRDPVSRAFAVDTNDRRPIGLARVYDIDWVDRRCAISLLIGEPDYRGRGYEEDALRLLAGYLFRQLNLNRLELWATADESTLTEAARAAGLVEEARLAEYTFVGGRYVDRICFRMLARDFCAGGGPAQVDSGRAMGL